MGMELIYSQNNSAVPLMKKICCGALMLKTSLTAGGASEPAVDTCRLCGNACCRPCRNKAARHAQRRQHNQLSARHESVLLSKISAGQTPCSGPQVSRRRRSCTPQMNCGCSGIAASVSPRSTEEEHFNGEMLRPPCSGRRVYPAAASPTQRAALRIRIGRLPDGHI